MRNRPDPTRPLPNPRHEAFVQALLRGEPATQAYASAGYKPNRANAARLTTNDDIKARSAHLKGAVTERVVADTSITLADVIKELAILGFANIKHYATKTVNGQAYVDLTNATDAQWAAIQELTSETYTEGKGEDAKLVVRTKIKLHGKEPSLVQIGKHLGLGKDRGPAPSDAVLVPQLPSQERLEEMRKRFDKPTLRTIDGGKQE
ncbi:terminase small subunit [Hyphomicrobium sp. xq]|uniref:Terminase small subunit n=1 Tax=Hyphomicrobium album TaxID=2665159 RepID=A0A6I3KJ16_9HYPH|nr:terminase small subunit [Hyphomicrobium album]MTD93920.1 terminase small subunit [Hyphomicrobium album]